MKFRSIKSKVVFKSVLLLLLAILFWFSFYFSRYAEGADQTQDRRFDGPFLCSCWQGGTFLGYGCGFSCSRDGNDCYESAHCFCPCYEE